MKSPAFNIQHHPGYSAYNQIAQKKRLGISEAQMEVKSPIKITLLVSALFLGISLLIAHEFAVGYLSSRGMGFALLVLCAVAAVAFLLVMAARGKCRLGRTYSRPSAVAKRIFMAAHGADLAGRRSD